MSAEGKNALTTSEIVEIISSDAGANTSEIAKQMGMSPQALNNSMNRNSALSSIALFKIAQKTGKPMEYFLTGDKSLLSDFKDKEIEKLKMKLEFLTEERDRLLEAISGNFHGKSEMARKAG